MWTSRSATCPHAHTALRPPPIVAVGFHTKRRGAANCQLGKEINSEDEAYIRRKCRERIDMAGTFAVLIGQDTRSKHKYVRWEMEVAREKGCRIIGINLDGSRRVVDATCPPIIRNIGAIFVPFSPKIVAYALENYQMHENDDYHYKDKVYKQLGFK